MYDVTVKEEDVQGALKIYDEAVQAGIKAEEMWAKPMLQLQDLLKQHNQVVPWPVSIYVPTVIVSR